MPQTRKIVVTSLDMQRLHDLIRTTREAHLEDPQYLDALENELSQAQVIESGEVPGDVITMNSTVQVRVDDQKRLQTWTVVYPQDANMDENRISVLAPLGTALLGYRVGDTLEWQVPAGQRRYSIVKILHQPEAAGEFDR